MFFVLRPPPPPISFPMVRPLEILAQLHKVSEIVPKSLFLCVNRRPFRYGFSAGSKAIWFRACLHGGGRPQIGEVTWGGSPHLSCKRDQIKMTDYMDRRLPHLSGLPQLPEVHHLHVNILKPYCDSSFAHLPSIVHVSQENLETMRAQFLFWRAVWERGKLRCIMRDVQMSDWHFRDEMICEQRNNTLLVICNKCTFNKLSNNIFEVLNF